MAHNLSFGAAGGANVQQIKALAGGQLPLQSGDDAERRINVAAGAAAAEGNPHAGSLRSTGPRRWLARLGAAVGADGETRCLDV